MKGGQQTNQMPEALHARTTGQSTERICVSTMQTKSKLEVEPERVGGRGLMTDRLTS